MATIREKKFFTLVSNDIGKSPKMVSNYLDAIIDRLVKEILRGNTVSIKNLGFFRPKLTGDTNMLVCGKEIYVEPKLTIKYEMSNIMKERLNRAELTKEEQKELKSTEVVDMQSLLKNRTKDKRNLEDMFEVIKLEVAKKQKTNDNDLDVEEDDEDDI